MIHVPIAGNSSVLCPKCGLPWRPPVCRHLGIGLREVDCATCAGRTRIKVFACAIHGECSLAKDVGVAVCRTCPDYEAIRRAASKAPPP